MKLTLKTPPLHEPLNCEEVKDYLKLTSDEEDSFLPFLIKAARAHVESITGRSLLKQVWTMEIKPPYPSSSPLVKLKGLSLEIRLPKPPLLEVLTVTLDNKPVRFSTSGDILRLSGELWDQDLIITFASGYGERSDSLPADLKMATLMATRFFYEGNLTELPLLSPYKAYRFI